MQRQGFNPGQNIPHGGAAKPIHPTIEPAPESGSTTTEPRVAVTGVMHLRPVLCNKKKTLQ